MANDRHREPVSRPEIALRLLAMAAIAPLVVALAACPAERRPDEDSGEPASETASDESAATAAGEEPAAEPTAEAEEGSAENEVDDSAPLGPPRVPPSTLVPGEGNLYGVMNTTQGVIVVRLLEDEAPLAVANFVGLATGQVRYQDPETEAVERGRFYDGVIFHRVIPDFMIQGGDPTGTGRGGPGYRFEDERQELAFDRPGLLAMANAGPDTNGSQFFITERATPHLTGRHTIFGTVESGMDVVRAIARVPTGPMNRPQPPVVLERVEIVRADTPPSP